MQNSINEKIYQESRSAVSLKNLGAKKSMYFIVMILSPILMAPFLIIPVFGWFAYLVLIAGSGIMYGNVKRLHQMDQYRWKIIEIKDSEHVEMIFMDDYYALTTEDRIIMVMDVIEIDKNKKLRDLLVAQHSPKNELGKIYMTLEEFKNSQGGASIGI